MPAGTAHSVESAAQDNANDALGLWVNTAGGAGEAWLNDWRNNLQSRVAADARANCRDLGYPIARSIKTHNLLRFYYSEDLDSGADYQFQASYERPYTATCYKRVRR